MLKKKYRIPKNSFSNIKKNGQLINVKTFSVLFLINNHNQPRFAIIVSKKISKIAPQRNKIKRLFREAIKKNLLIAPQKTDIIFLAKKNSLNIDLNNLYFQVIKVFNKISEKNNS